jgi:hypothetical protein
MEELKTKGKGKIPKIVLKEVLMIIVLEMRTRIHLTHSYSRGGQTVCKTISS